ncbi:response regulator [Skermanella sp. TT6]|uniref:Response regulator n=1 Tax=Skermanella cutis TaxID=2775420 RepID=A0ABX7BBS7_9PROT|nr:response regulator [Skermanella sp. TT6]QQP89897.1 response regulator [Skermanella sp. TT6]
MTAVQSLQALRVLVVEDEVLVAMAVKETLERFGCVVVGPVGRVRRAMELVGAELDAAVLDVNIAGERVFPVAEALTSRGVPVVFTTGYGMGGIDGVFPLSTVLQKPYLDATLAAALANAVGRAS